ncbi:hypothetical protein [Paraburkholderia sp. J67]|uniref:hypothetical protein n=1 Tax=Paraburkholderia sp. J67 TaxID=2805435 RepID=UPI002ABE458C|nr:hypothetical protein [Paraburkholderia sp. J67]
MLGMDGVACAGAAGEEMAENRLKEAKARRMCAMKKSPAARAGLSSVDNCLKLKQLGALYGKPICA